jgi:hypothetical protein
MIEPEPARATLARPKAETARAADDDRAGARQGDVGEAEGRDREGSMNGMIEPEPARATLARRKAETAREA